MFRLYCFFDFVTPTLVFTNEDLAPCLNFMKSHNFMPMLCAIISPNNRKITFNNNYNDMIFSEPVKEVV